MCRHIGIVAIVYLVIATGRISYGDSATPEKNNAKTHDSTEYHGHKETTSARTKRVTGDDNEHGFWANRGKKAFNLGTDLILDPYHGEYSKLFSAYRQYFDDRPGLQDRYEKREPGDGPFWGNRGKRVTSLDGLSQFTNAMVRRQGTEEIIPTWPSRGRRGDIKMQQNNRSRREEDEPFWGNRGRRNDDGSVFWGNRGRRSEDSDPFWGNRGRRSDDVTDKISDDSPFWGNRGKIDPEDEPFWGNRGKRDPEEPFWGNRGKKDPEEPFWGNRGKKESEEPFWGNRGKKNIDEPFWGNRGRRSDENPFWGTRGKKNVDDPFWGTRGKKNDDPFWGTRGKRGDNVDPFWGNRGKKSKSGYKLTDEIVRVNNIPKHIIHEKYLISCLADMLIKAKSLNENENQRNILKNASEKSNLVFSLENSPGENFENSAMELTENSEDKMIQLKRRKREITKNHQRNSLSMKTKEYIIAMLLEINPSLDDFKSVIIKTKNIHPKIDTAAHHQSMSTPLIKLSPQAYNGRIDFNDYVKKPNDDELFILDTLPEDQQIDEFATINLNEKNYNNVIS